jgi:hypothetical protein
MSETRIANIDFNNTMELIKSLPKTQQDLVRQKIVESGIKMQEDFVRNFEQSKLADADINKIIKVVKELEAEGKIINATQTIKTGTGEIRIDVKGGDKKLIYPIIIAIVVIIIAILYFLLGKR